MKPFLLYWRGTLDQRPYVRLHVNIFTIPEHWRPFRSWKTHTRLSLIQGRNVSKLFFVQQHITTLTNTDILFQIIPTFFFFFFAYNHHQEPFWIQTVMIFSPWPTVPPSPKYYENWARNSGDSQKTNQQTRLKTQLGLLGKDNISDPKDRKISAARSAHGRWNVEIN